MTSLKELLNQKIREKGYLSAEQVYKICLEEGYKLSNAERRLRASESPDIEPVMARSKRGTNYISGYKVLENEESKLLKLYDEEKKILDKAINEREARREKQFDMFEGKFTYKVQQPVWRDEG